MKICVNGEFVETGANGATFIPSVSEAGVISWTNNGGLENPEPVCINGPAGPGNPTGTIISYMGTSAPNGYLVCDGAEYGVNDYPALSAHFTAHFGGADYFGGNGTTTFAVPDMRNLFLRGYHGNTAEQLSGSVGQKQNGTEHPAVTFGTNTSNKAYMWANYSKRILSDSDMIIPNADMTARISGTHQFGYSAPDSASAVQDPTVSTYTSRPVNMAVLYCIKAT